MQRKVVKLGKKIVKENETKEKKSELRFSKEQIAASSKYRSRKDLVNALLENGKTYTIEEVDIMIDKFMKGKVN